MTPYAEWQLSDKYVVSRDYNCDLFNLNHFNFAASKDRAHLNEFTMPCIYLYIDKHYMNLQSNY